MDSANEGSSSSSSPVKLVKGRFVIESEDEEEVKNGPNRSNKASGENDEEEEEDSDISELEESEEEQQEQLPIRELSSTSHLEWLAAKRIGTWQELVMRVTDKKEVNASFDGGHYPDWERTYFTKILLSNDDTTKVELQCWDERWRPKLEGLVKYQTYIFRVVRVKEIRGENRRYNEGNLPFTLGFYKCSSFQKCTIPLDAEEEGGEEEEEEQPKSSGQPLAVGRGARIEDEDTN